jgi:hypothetical protein
MTSPLAVPPGSDPADRARPCRSGRPEGRLEVSTVPFTELRVVTPAAWVARDLATGTTLPVVHDLGLDVSHDLSHTAWWSGHRFIARLAATPDVAQPRLSSPGAAWIASVDPRFIQRQVWAGQFVDAARSPLWSRSGGVFAKAAEIKLNLLPAAVHTDAQGFVDQAQSAGLAPGSGVVLSEVTQFLSEFRCFVAPGPDGQPAVVASSAYLVGEVTWDFWESATDAPDSSEAAAFAQLVARATPGPAGYVIDVGRLADNSWAVVEPNASWSANPYHCDPAGVVASVLAAQDPAGGDNRWAWASDPAIDQYARPLPVRQNPTVPHI